MEIQMGKVTSIEAFNSLLFVQELYFIHFVGIIGYLFFENIIINPFRTKIPQGEDIIALDFS